MHERPDEFNTMGTVEVLWFLCDWYRAQCTPELHDGDGITIEAVDGPGWWLTIDVCGTSLEGHTMEPLLEDLGEGAWVQAWCDGAAFEAASSIHSLLIAVQMFRDFVRDIEAPRWEDLLTG